MSNYRSCSNCGNTMLCMGVCERCGWKDYEGSMKIFDLSSTRAQEENQLTIEDLQDTYEQIVKDWTESPVWLHRNGVATSEEELQVLIDKIKKIEQDQYPLMIVDQNEEFEWVLPDIEIDPTKHPYVPVFSLISDLAQEMAAENKTVPKETVEALARGELISVFGTVDPRDWPSTKNKEPVCECGATKCGLTTHSEWCAMYKGDK